MGFSTLLDILGSTIVGGILLVILWRLDDAATQNTFNYGGEVIVQSNLVEVVQLLEYDFRKIGYCKDWTKIPDPSQAIISADSTSIRFLTDTNMNGIVDTLRYYLGPASELTMTPNPRDRMLYRVENHNTPAGANLGVTQFNLSYYNALGALMSFPISNPGQIATMQIDMKIESTAAYNNEYPTVFWRQIRMSSRNLRNR
ncbi:MAG: hypothetical protein NTZ27_11185 [Ignavibacteriales bacterium]|nr:hypothetical protein [Ignavibacteriales bacterium]